MNNVMCENSHVVDKADNFCRFCGAKLEKALPLYYGEGIANKKLYRRGEYRAPRKGEYFLSGANPIAYKAHNDLDTNFYIAVEANV